MRIFCSNWRLSGIRLAATAISPLLTILMIVMGWVPNEDAFTFIRTVEVYNDQGLVAAFNHYPWAAYPVLIAVVQYLLPLDPFQSAVAVNAIFYSLLVYSFISLVAELDRARATIILAAITILVYPQLNEYRLIIIRDSAYWALALFGLWQYLCFLRNRQLQSAIAFSLSYLLAATFRVEALLFLFAIPISLLLDSRLNLRDRTRLVCKFTASSAGIVALLIGLGFLAGLNLPALLVEQLSVYIPLARETFFPPEQRTSELGRVIFGDFAANFSSDYLPVFMLSGLMAILLVLFFQGIGGPLLLVMLAGFVRRIRLVPRWQLLPLLVVILMNGLIAITFLITTRFLTVRYVQLMCLICVVFVPLLLARLRIAALASDRGRGYHWLVGILFSYCAVDAYVSFGTDKSYLREAGEWIAQNSSPTVNLLANNRAVAYYSERIEEYDLVPILLTEGDVISLPAGSLVAFEEDTSSLGLFDNDRLRRSVEEVTRTGADSGRQVVIYRRLPE